MPSTRSPGPCGLAASMLTLLVACSDRSAPPAEPQPRAATRVEEPATPSPDDFRIDAARALMRQGRFDLAEAALRTVLAEQIDSDRARFFLAVAVGKQKRYGEARVLYEAVLASRQTFPERIHAEHFLGWALYYLGEPEAARVHFLAHAEAVPGDGDSAFAIGLIALDADDRPEAERWLEEAIRRQENDPTLAREVAKAEARLGDLRYREDRVEEAIELWQRCVARWPDHHEAWSKLARGHARLGRDAEAALATRQWELALERIGRPLEGAASGGSP
ncbi:MAG: tetratricopeptide repeat protein [Phycisphaerales bacterium]